MARRLGRFEIVEELGSGAMGRVYLARDPALHRSVAIKVLPAGAIEEQRRARFLAEARAASALSHPAIVTIHELGRQDDVDFIVMELVEGQSLAELLAEGPLEAAEVKRHAIVLAEALSVAHRAGIVHRDLKPGNIMLSRGGYPKVLDFGIAKRIAAGTSPGSADGEPTVTKPPETAVGGLIGTPAYMAPEQALGRPVDPRADLFSLGCVLYEMLTGQPPFRRESAVETLSAVLEDEPPAVEDQRPDLPAAWDVILRRLLAKRPEDRYADAESLLGDLRDMGRTAAARRPPIRKGAWAALSVCVVLAVVALVVVSWKRGGEAGGSEPVAQGDRLPDYRFELVTQLPDSQREPSLSPDGRMVAFAMADAAGVDQIWVMDLAGGDPRQITFGEKAAGSPEWTETGDRILFDRAYDGIWQVPPLGGDAHQLLPEGSHPVASRDGSRLAYNDRRGIWLADGDGTDPRPLAGFGSSHFGYFARPDFSPEGDRIVTFWPRPDSPLGDLWIAPVDGGSPRRLTDIGFLSWGTAPVWTADGEWILFTSDHGGSINLWRIHSDGGEPSAITAGAGSDLSPDVSRDASRLIYANGRHAARIRLHDPPTGHSRTVFERRNLAITPRLSPSGDRAAFFARAEGGFHLFVADLAEGRARQVTHGRRVVNTHPRWSLDGETLYYYQQPHADEPRFTFRRISVDGRGDEMLIPGWRWPNQHQAQPSPDESRVVYLVRRAGRNIEARVRELASGEEYALPRPLYDPQWTSDGSEIYGSTWKPYRVHFCQADGSECRAVTDGWWARLSADEATLYTLRGGPPAVWKHDRASGQEEELFTIESYDRVNFGWGVTPSGQVMFHSQHAGKLELWLGEAQPSIQ
jgi:Tol biopolymer transport system component/predicted Ser/Thr protein kinase